MKSAKTTWDSFPMLGMHESGETNDRAEPAEIAPGCMHQSLQKDAVVGFGRFHELYVGLRCLR